MWTWGVPLVVVQHGPSHPATTGPRDHDRRNGGRSADLHPDAEVVVKPVTDLADHVSVDAYEVPDHPAASRSGARDAPGHRVDPAPLHGRSIARSPDGSSRGCPRTRARHGPDRGPRRGRAVTRRPGPPGHLDCRWAVLPDECPGSWCPVLGWGSGSVSPCPPGTRTGPLKPCGRHSRPPGHLDVRRLLLVARAVGALDLDQAATLVESAGAGVGLEDPQLVAVRVGRVDDVEQQ